jgi:hypothetical protein
MRGVGNGLAKGLDCGTWVLCYRPSSGHCPGYTEYETKSDRRRIVERINSWESLVMIEVGKRYWTRLKFKVYVSQSLEEYCGQR